MKRVTAWFAAAVLVAGLAGCGSQEREELRAKVTNLEQQLAKVNVELAEKDATARAAVEQSEQQVKQAQANIDALTAELVKVKEERDKFKNELAKLRKTKK